MNPDQTQQPLWVCPAGLLSNKKRGRQLKSPLDDSQTEYVKIASAVMRPCVGVLTDRQKEVLARQRAGMGPTQHGSPPGRKSVVHVTHGLCRTCRALSSNPQIRLLIAGLNSELSFLTHSNLSMNRGRE